MSDPARLTIRERIMAALKLAFEGQTLTVLGEDIQWDAVVRARLSDKERKMKSCVSIMEGRDAKEDSASTVTTRNLEVSIEFEIKTYLGDEPAAFANEVAGAIQKFLGEFNFTPGLLHIRENSNEVDVGSGDDRSVGGILFCLLRYRHRTGDPTRSIGE